jgi:hypothetical protein
VFITRSSMWPARGAAGVATVATACALAFAAPADAQLPPVDAVAPLPVGVVLTGPPDLVVSATTPTTVTIANRGRSAAGPFSVLVAKGYIHCGVTVAQATARIGGLAAGGSMTIRVAPASFARAVTADYLNDVAEGSELNNSGTVPGTNIVC